MRIDCIHGYFKFHEDAAGDISDFMNLYGFELVHKDSYFTFDFLKDAPKYSLKGALYLGAEATETFEGEPWEVLAENDLVYDFTQDEVVALEEITQRFSLDSTEKYFVTTGLILPGSFTEDGTRVTDYAAWYLKSTQRFKYSEVTLG